MMPGQSKRYPGAIYVTSGGVTESREVLADNRTSPMAAGSVSSIPVIREQYCLCTPTTKLEKKLVIVVIVLVLVILVLIIVISVLADRERGKELREMIQALTPKI